MTRPDMPSDIRSVRNLLIGLGDGVELAADLYLPHGDGPFPTLLSFYPYRKDDIIGAAFEHPRRELVRRGYAHLLVDVRGYGGSGGAPVESMAPGPEGADASEAIAWAAAQDWSTGDVGVWGVSYGGLVAFAAAAQRPPALRAIAAIHGFSDVYGDAIAPGGVPLCLGRYARETVMLAQELSPPTFQDDAGRWECVWRERLERLETTGPWSLRWPEHQDAGDPYWRERSVELERVAVPALLIAGWRDMFAETMTRAARRMHAPCRVIVGPWLHVAPDLGPEPIDWIDELGRFFDAHVRGNRAAPEPGATVFVQGAGGGWRRFAAWPPPAAEEHVLHLGGRELRDAPAEHGSDRLASADAVGVAAGLHDPLGTGVGLPREQAPDDRRSLTYTTPPLARELVIAGSPAVRLDVELDGNGGDLIAKLVDVDPRGAATLITTGWLRCAGGQASIRLAAVAYRLPAGHRLRLSVAASDFPRTWPRQGSFELRHAGSALSLPLLPGHDGGAGVEPRRPVPTPERAPWTTETEAVWTIARDEVAATVAVTSGGSERIRTPTGASVSIEHQATALAADGRPEAAVVDSRARIELALPAGEMVRVEVRGHAGRNRQRYDGRVSIDGRLLLERSWSTTETTSAAGAGPRVDEPAARS